MSLQIPDLDDRSFDDLMKEALSLIPIYSKEWTNHNPSDPGITLVELFAWLSEMVIYRVNRIPDESYVNFLKLLAGAPENADIDKLLNIPFLFNWDSPDRFEAFRNFLKDDQYIDWAQNAVMAEIRNNTILRASSGKNWADLMLDENKKNAVLKINGSRIRYLHVDDDLNIYSVPDLDEMYRNLIETLKEIRTEQKKLPEIKEAAVGFMESQYRAITSKDFEEKTLNCMKKLQKGMKGRAICVNNRDLEHSRLDDEKPWHISMIIIPGWQQNSIYCKDELNPSDLLIEEVKADLAARRLITTRVHVVAPFYQDIRLRIQIALKENVNENEVISEAQEELEKYFHPITGGPDRNGWPLGRNVYRSEIYHLLEGIERVDHVSKIWINGDPEMTSVEIREHQLIALTEIIVEKVTYE